MNREPFFSSDLWECTLPEVQGYLRALEARVAVMEATVKQLREQLQQDWRTSSCTPSSDSRKP